MIKNKKIKTCIIGACIIANTMGMTAFADTTDGGLQPQPGSEVPDKAAVMEVLQFDANSPEDEKIYKTQILQANESDPMLQKQSEIDQYLFETHKDEIAGKGFTVTHTVAVGSQIEIGIKPFEKAHVDYLNEVFGEDAIVVVAGENPEIYQVAMVTPEDTAEKNDSKIVSFFEGIWEWFKNIF